MVRHKVSLVFPLPSLLQAKDPGDPGGIRKWSISNGLAGSTRTTSRRTIFAQFGTDPAGNHEGLSRTFRFPPTSWAWQHDRAGAIVDVGLAKKFGWKIGDRLNITGQDFPVESGTDHSGNLHAAGTRRNPSTSTRTTSTKAFPNSREAKVSSRSWLIRPSRSPRWRQAIDETVSQRRQAHQDRDRTCFPVRLYRDAGQHQGLHHEHLPGGGLHHPAGIGQHHGYVDS